MVQKTVIISKNQSLFDVVLQEFGSLALLPEIALLNKLSFTADVKAGSSILLPQAGSSFNTEVVNYYFRYSIKPVTGKNIVDPATGENVYLFPQTFPLL